VDSAATGAEASVASDSTTGLRLHAHKMRRSGANSVFELIEEESSRRKSEVEGWDNVALKETLPEAKTTVEKPAVRVTPELRKGFAHLLGPHRDM
jgi:hypothetical protein